jgi:8-oxo-dGTP pyrophosphatase MutT (NUDIX family)
VNGNRPQPVTAVPAATLVLARERETELQVLLLRRSTQSRFMGGNYVFPGGRLEAADENLDWWQPHVDLGPDLISRRLGGDMTGSAPFAAAVAAIRETFEEAGVLLADHPTRAGGELQKVCRRRLSGALPPGWLQQLVQKGGWIIALSRLLRWSRWVTPVGMRYRYDTRFFAARMPTGQVCAPDMQEAVHALWIRPAEALERNLSGEFLLSPPTLMTLHEMLPYTRLQLLEDAAAKRRWGSPLLPRWVSDGSEMMIVEPWDPEYRRPQIRIDAAALRAGVTSVGKPFSRLWFSGGSWKPVAV